MAFLERKQRSVNVNLVYLPNIVTEVRGKLIYLGIAADEEYVFIQSRVIDEWLYMEGRHFHVRHLVDFVRNGQTSNFTEDMTQLVVGDRPCMTGILWLGDNAFGPRPVKVVEMRDGAQKERFFEGVSYDRGAR